MTHDQLEREQLIAELDRLKLRNAQLEAEAAARTSVEVMGFLGHKIKTLLNAIVGFASMMEDGTAGPLTDEQYYYIGRVINAADLMHNLVNELVRDADTELDFFGSS